MFQEDKSNLRFRGLLKKLAIELKQNKKSELCRELQALFVSECHRIFLSEQDLKVTPEIAAAVASTLRHLNPSVQERYTEILNHNYESLEGFAADLVDSNLLANAKPRERPTIHKDYEYKTKVLETVWLLTACQIDFNSERTFNFDVIAARCLGLLLSHSYLELLVCIRRLYPDFDTAQKLVANFIVLQLLIHHVNDKILPFPTLTLQLRFIRDLNAHEDHGLPETIAESINDRLDKALELNMSFSKLPLFRNFHLLNRAIGQPDFVQMSQSFDELVNNALQTRSKKRRAHQISLIAGELKMLTIYLYQHVSIDEYANNGWSKENKAELAPHVCQLTNMINKLNLYFAEKILTQPKDNVKNVLRFISELTEAICPLEGERYPDLNSTVLLSSVLDRICVSRLKPIFDTLKEREKKIFEELEIVVSTRKNAEYMRKIYSNRRTALPFSGNLVKQITFAQEGNDGNRHNDENNDSIGNEQILNRAEASGAVLRTLMEVKLLINFTRVHFHTNLPVFITQYQEPSEELLDCLSYRLLPNKSHVINLDTATNGLASIFDDLQSNYLSKKILPGIIFERKLYPYDQLATKLIHYVAAQLTTLTSEEARPSLTRLRNVVNEIIEINNEYYYPKKLAEKLSAKSYLAQISKLEKQTMPIQEKGREKEQEKEKEAEEKKYEKESRPLRTRKDTIKRRSLHFLESISIIHPAKKADDDKEPDNNPGLQG